MDTTFCRATHDTYTAIAKQADAVLGIHVLAKNMAERYHKLRNAGIDVFILPTEGIPTFREDVVHILGLDRDLTCVSQFYVWNDPVKSAALATDKVSKEAIHVVGPPRFDFYFPPLSEALLQKSELCQHFHWDATKPLVFFPTNFSIARYHDPDVEGLFEKEIQLYKFDKMYKGAKDFPMLDWRCRNRFFDALEKAIENFPPCNVLIKPHPNADQKWEKYRVIQIQSLMTNPHVKIGYTDQIMIWDIINCADLVGGRSCTTCIEAWLMAKPTLEIQMLENSNYMRNEEHRYCSYFVTNAEELSKGIVDALSNGATSEMKEHQDAYILEWCGYRDGKSTKRLADKMSRYLHDRKVTTDTNSIPLPERFKAWIKLQAMSKTGFRAADWKNGKFFRRSVDVLGRFNKNICLNDIAYWEKKLEKILFR